MKKLFVSCPMAGRKEENIKESIRKMHEIAEIMLGEKLELIDSYLDEVAPADVNNHGLWFLAKSLERMVNADYVIGFAWNITCSKHKGCEIEMDAAEGYDIPTFEIRDEDMAKKILPDINFDED